MICTRSPTIRRLWLLNRVETAVSRTGSRGRIQQIARILPITIVNPAGVTNTAQDRRDNYTRSVPRSAWPRDGGGKGTRARSAGPLNNILGSIFPRSPVDGVQESIRKESGPLRGEALAGKCTP